MRGGVPVLFTPLGSGLCASALLALDLVVHGGALDTLCDLSGLASALLFIGLLEGV